MCFVYLAYGFLSVCFNLFSIPFQHHQMEGGACVSAAPKPKWLVQSEYFSKRTIAGTMACLIIFKRAYIMLHVAHFIGPSCAWCWQCSWLCLIIFVVYRCGSLCGLPVVLHIVASSRVFSRCFICHLFLNIICDCFRSRRAHETFWCRTIIGKEGMPKSNMTSWSSYLAFFVSWFHHICNHPWIELSAPVSSSLCPLDVTHWQDMAVVTRNELCPQVGSQENGPRQMPWGSEPWQIQIGGKNVCWALPCLATLCCRVEVESCFFCFKFHPSKSDMMSWWWRCLSQTTSPCAGAAHQVGVQCIPQSPEPTESLRAVENHVGMWEMFRGTGAWPCATSQSARLSFQGTLGHATFRSFIF